MGSSVEVTFYEIHGKKCYDLLSQRKVVHLRSDQNEEVHIRGARSLVSLSPSDAVNFPPKTGQQTSETKNESTAETIEYTDYGTMVTAVHEAMKIRSSEVTERNPISSRSHAVCIIKLLSPPPSASKATATSNHSDADLGCDDSNGLRYYGKLTMVDLAGSERNYETTKMTAAQHRESADINFALMALKDCFRAYFARSMLPKTILKTKTPGGADLPQTLSSSSISDSCPTRAPYRASPLTRVLRECFVDSPNDTDRRHHTTIITTLSPNPADVQHSLNSLEHVVLMNPSLQSQVHEVIVEVPLLEGFLSGIPISAWTAEQVLFWLSTTNNGRFAQLILPPGLDGNGLMKLNMVSLSALCEGTLRAARQDEEGSAWVVQGVASDDVSAGARHNYLGRALWAALRREQQLQRL
jgi:Kinesin motor domain